MSLKLIARALMARFPGEPLDDLALWEVFRKDGFVHGTERERERLMLDSATYRYREEERECCLQALFPAAELTALRDKSLLDLGCFTGGRLASWKERFGFGYTSGIDINPIFEQAGRLLAEQRGLEIDFRTGVAEALPYDDGTFDRIVSIDVLEHVESVERTLSQCHRVLRDGGRLLVSFPQFLQPYESHLGLVTTLPAIHWFFPGRVLAEAAYEIQRDRGPAASWYAIPSPALQPWEKLPSLNGISAARWRRLIRKDDWKVVHRSAKPVRLYETHHGRPLLNAVGSVFRLAARIPVIEELVLSRINYVLEARKSA